MADLTALATNLGINPNQAQLPNWRVDDLQDLRLLREDAADVSPELPDHADPRSLFSRSLMAASLTAADLMAIEPELKEFTVPTLVVWGTGDQNFALRWAYWLRDTIAGATEVVEVEGGKLFFPEERPADLVPHLLRFWDGNGPR
ncbi:alpha/beta hydrolase [Saccharopolyspora shandongensis]|uniref:alpha/beta fold hydrolase n=1 Tax=Saccharopolyspora shandongensis TaxID=418495 RepID=UPI0033FB6E1A